MGSNIPSKECGLRGVHVTNVYIFPFVIGTKCDIQHNCQYNIFIVVAGSRRCQDSLFYMSYLFALTTPTKRTIVRSLLNILLC